KSWRASPKRPRENSLCARSKARIAAISSCEGFGRGAGRGGVCVRTGAAAFVGRALVATGRFAGLAVGRLAVGRLTDFAALAGAFLASALPFLAGGAFFFGLAATCLPFVAFTAARFAPL